jgi:hypothetical protein
MHLSQERVSEFQRLYETHFRKQFTNDEATQKALRLVRLMEIIYTPLRHEDVALVQERNAALKIARSASLRDNSSQEEIKNK